VIVAVHPEVEALRNQIDALQCDLLLCQEQWHATSVVLRAHLTQSYHRAFGDVESEIQQLALQHAELFRRVELLTIKHDRGEAISLETIEHIIHFVDREYHHMRERLKPVGLGNEAHDSQAEEVAVGNELVQLFRVVAKRLHPDARAGQAQDDLWHRARRAYEGGDVRTLKAIAAGTDAMSATYHHLDIDELRVVAERLAGRLEAEQKKLARLKTEEPFTLQNVLDDEQWKQLHRATLEHQRDAWVRAIEQAQARYYELTKHATLSDVRVHKQQPTNGDDTVRGPGFMESTYFGQR
jgi:hypothetical protein